MTGQLDAAPEEWQSLTLGDLGSFSTSSVDKKVSAQETPVRLVNYMDVYRHRFIDRSLELMQVTGRPEELSRSQVAVGDLLFTPSSETPDDIGHSAVVVDDMPRTLHSYHTVRLRPNGRHPLDVRFLGRVANAASVLNFFGTRATGSTRYTLTLSDFRAAPVRLPPVTEQRCIAAVLDAMDHAIANTEQVIAKLELMKRGLREEVLTRGIDEAGELRDTDGMERRESSVRIPAGWTVRRLRDCLVGNAQNGIYKPEGAIGSGVLLVGQTAITSLRRIDLRRARRARITASELDRYSIRNGDILLSRVFATVAGVGQPALVSELAEPAVYESNMMRLRVDCALLHPAFLFLVLLSSGTRRYIESVANSSNQTSINQRDLNRLRLRVPSLEEQARILGVLAAEEERVTREDETLRKLKMVRAGFASDLLSGQIRVTQLVEEAPA